MLNLAALMPVFKKTYENAVPVLVQGNRYLYTASKETDTDTFMYLLGGYRHNGDTVPVQFEVKRNSKQDDNTLYVVATIKKDAIKVLEPASATPRATAPFSISIEDLIGNVKEEEGKIVANLPWQFLTEEQKKTKRDEQRHKGGAIREKAQLPKYGKNPDAPVTMTAERIDREIQNSGAKFQPDYALRYMAYIDPADFLSLTTANREQIENESRVLVASEMRDERQTPVLYYDQETGQVTSQEGRHSMMALMNAGVHQVAILVEPDTKGKNSRSTIPTLELIGRSFGDVSAPGAVTLENLIPVNEKHRQELIDTYGESDNWFQYSTRDTEYKTNRQLLGEALLTIAANESERQMLESYQDIAAKLDANEKRIGEINTAGKVRNAENPQITMRKCCKQIADRL